MSTNTSHEATGKTRGGVTHESVRIDGDFGRGDAGRADARRGGGGQHGQCGDHAHRHGRSLSPAGCGLRRQRRRSRLSRFDDRILDRIDARVDCECRCGKCKRAGAASAARVAGSAAMWRRACTSRRWSRIPRRRSSATIPGIPMPGRMATSPIPTLIPSQRWWT